MHLLLIPKLDVSAIGDKQAVDEWALALENQLNDLEPKLDAKVEAVQVLGGDDGNGHWLPRVTLHIHRLPHQYLLDTNFLGSADYMRLLKLSANWNTVLSNSAFCVVVTRISSLKILSIYGNS